ncbi:MAG: PAS domain S-box protein [Thermotogota bacterium]
MENKKYSDLREKAISQLPEEKLNKKDYKDLNNVIHELKVHQIELEIQNDELVQTQRKLIDLNQKFYDLYNFAPLCYLTLNSSGDIIESNFKAYEYFKLKKDDLLSKSILNFVDISDYDEMLKHLQNVKETGTLQTQEIKFKDKYGENFVGLIQSVINDSKKERIIYSAIIDITNEKQKEIEIEESYKNINKLINNMQEIILIIDEQGIIKLANERLLKLVGDNEENLIGNEFISLISPEKRIDAYKKLNQLYNKDYYESIFSLIDIENKENDFEIIFNKGYWKNQEVYFCSGRKIKKESEDVLKINDTTLDRLKEYIEDDKKDMALDYINEIKTSDKDKNSAKMIQDLNILLIEDNKPDTLKETLESFNKNITVMSDIYKVLDDFRDNYYNIIILKISSGEMSKLEFLKRIKRNYDIPIIGIFSDFNRENIKKFVESGLDDFIIKPILKNEALKETINNIIKK